MSWQTDLSSKSVKKLQKYKIVDKIIPDCAGKLCLEIGAETGVVTDYLRRRKGGKWIAGALEDRWREASLELLKEDVVTIDPEAVKFGDSTFDIVLVSRPEHIKDDVKLFGEVFRILKKGGDIFLLSPHKSPALFLNWVKERVGLTLEQYDHYRPGYSLKEARDKLQKTGFKILKSGSYCRFFSEIIELTLNAVYAFKDRKKAAGEKEKAGPELSYRPVSEQDITRDKLLFRLYRVVFPVFNLLSKLDYFLFFTQGYVMYTRGRKE